jgi:hypothetical protein
MSFVPRYIPATGGMVVFSGYGLQVYSDGVKVYEGASQTFTDWESWDAFGTLGPGLQAPNLLYAMSNGQTLVFYNMKVTSLFLAVGWVRGVVSARAERPGLYYAFGEISPQPPQDLVRHRTRQ